MDKRRISTTLATRVVNPLVRWAVRHGLAPSSYAILETTGRRSGRVISRYKLGQTAISLISIVKVHHTPYAARI